MGCDIHAYLEVKDKSGSWISADPWRAKYPDESLSVPYHCRVYHDRNYDLFGFLADVRNGTWGQELPVVASPKGFPNDASKEVSAANEDYGVDGHSHTWLTLRELLSALKRAESEVIEFNGAVSPNPDNPELVAWLALDERKTPPPVGYSAGGWGPEGPTPHFKWTQTVDEIIGNEVRMIARRMGDAAMEYGIWGDDREDRVRMVFWFDN